MVLGGYSRWRLCAIGNLGWKKDRVNPKIQRHYITTLFGRINDQREPVVCCVSMAIAPVYTADNGRDYNLNSQFQLLFSPLNGNRSIKHPINHYKFLRNISEILDEQDINFYIRFQKGKNLLIKEIALCEDAVITDHEEFKWPEAVGKRLVELTAPSPGHSVDLLGDVSDSVSKIITVETDITLTDEEAA